MKIIQTTIILFLTLCGAFAQSVVEEEIEGRKALIAKVKQFSRLEVSLEDRSITSKDWPSDIGIMINRGKRLISVVMQLDDNRREGFSGKHAYSYRSEQPKTDLPRKVIIPDNKRPMISSWMKSKGYKYEMAYYQVKKNGKIEAYHTLLLVYIKGDNASSDVADVVEYLIDKVINGKVKTFKMTTHKRG